MKTNIKCLKEKDIVFIEDDIYFNGEMPADASKDKEVILSNNKFIDKIATLRGYTAYYDAEDGYRYYFN